MSGEGDPRRARLPAARRLTDVRRARGTAGRSRFARTRGERSAVAAELTDRMRSADTGGVRAAEARAWAGVRAAHATREPLAIRRRRWALAALLLGLVAGVVTLTPAGAKVGGWIGRTFDHPPPGTTLPAPGRLLVTTGSGAWIVDHDLSTRWLGPYGAAAWSARANFVVAAARDRLVALEPDGQVRWTLPRPSVSRVAWAGGDGFRIAYRSRDALRVVAGDGTSDRLLAAASAPVTPAWRPGPPGEHVLAYATKDHRVIVRDVDRPASTAVVRMRSALPVRAIAWAGRDRLLVLRRRVLTVMDGQGRFLRVIGSPDGGFFTHLATSPDGRRFAFVRIDMAGGTSNVWTAEIGPGATAAQRRPRQRFAGAASFGGFAFSPDGRWLVVDWSPADQWVFLYVAGRPRLATIRGINRLLDPGTRRSGAAPPGTDDGYGVEGWAP